MKTEREVRKKLTEISAKIDCIYNELKHGSMLNKDNNDLLHIFQTREDILEWVLEN